ncbi:MAG: hypothetical protein P4L87_07280 [Formivibrio sp.]|nr:hypothetical protein [Formivibrio sp.]
MIPNNLALIFSEQWWWRQIEFLSAAKELLACLFLVVATIYTFIVRSIYRRKFRPSSHLSKLVEERVAEQIKELNQKLLIEKGRSDTCTLHVQNLEEKVKRLATHQRKIIRYFPFLSASEDDSADGSEYDDFVWQVVKFRINAITAKLGIADRVQYGVVVSSKQMLANTQTLWFFPLINGQDESGGELVHLPWHVDVTVDQKSESEVIPFKKKRLSLKIILPVGYNEVDTGWGRLSVQSIDDVRKQFDEVLNH